MVNEYGICGLGVCEWCVVAIFKRYEDDARLAAAATDSEGLWAGLCDKGDGANG